MKKAILLIMLSVVISANIYAQSTTPANTNGKTHKSDIHFKQELNLSTDQIKQWKEIHKNGAEKRKTIMNNNTLSKDQKRDQLKNLNAEMVTQVNAMLTDDQKAKFAALKEKMKANWKEKHKNKENQNGG